MATIDHPRGSSGSDVVSAESGSPLPDSTAEAGSPTGQRRSSGVEGRDGSAMEVSTEMRFSHLIYLLVGHEVQGSSTGGRLRHRDNISVEGY